MSLAESLNWEQEEQYTSVFPRSVTSRKNQENLKLSEKKELLKKIADILAEEKWITSAELLVLKEKSKTTGAEFVILNSEQYQYNKDYFLGDTVLLTDTDSGLALAKPIEKVTHFYEKTYEMEITYGDAIPTIFTKK